MKKVKLIILLFILIFTAYSSSSYYFVKAKKESISPIIPYHGISNDIRDIKESVYQYYIQGDHAIITNYKGVEDKVSIPKFIDGYRIIEIGPNAFKNNKVIKSISIPDSITKIGVSAFLGCDNLIQAILPDNITCIEENTFKNCIHLKAIILPENLQEIKSNAFRSCKSLETIEFPKKIRDIEINAFAQCEKLEKLKFSGAAPPENYKNAFDDCNKLKDIYVNEKSKKAYEDVAGLESTTLYRTVSSVLTNSNRDWNSHTCHVNFPYISNAESYSINISSPLDPDSGSSVTFLKAGTYDYTFTNLRPDTIYFIDLSYSIKGVTYYINMFHVNTYPIRSKYILMSWDYDKHIKGKVSNNTLINWLNNLDKAYESYYELVGEHPVNGNGILLTETDSGLYVNWDRRDNRIYADKNAIGYILNKAQNTNGQDWDFGILHEMGHIFDFVGYDGNYNIYNVPYNFNAELFANFKMAYVLYDNNNAFTVVMTSPTSSYNDVINYYKGAYDSYFSITPMAFNHDAFTYTLLKYIDIYADWDLYKRLFRNVKNNPRGSGENQFQYFIRMTQVYPYTYYRDVYPSVYYFTSNYYK